MLCCTGSEKKNGEKIVSSSSRNIFDLSTGLPINIYTVYDSALRTVNV